MMSDKISLLSVIRSLNKLDDWQEKKINYLKKQKQKKIE